MDPIVYHLNKLLTITKLTKSQLAAELYIPPNRLTEIMKEEKPRALTLDTAMRLATFCSNFQDNDDTFTPDSDRYDKYMFWLGLQVERDLQAYGGSYKVIAPFRFGGKASR